MEKLVATICLYGNPDVGFGWRADSGRILLGDGELVRGRSATESVWLASLALREAAVGKGTVAIFLPCGTRVAYAHLATRIGAVGDLKWVSAPVYVKTLPVAS